MTDRIWKDQFLRHHLPPPSCITTGTSDPLKETLLTSPDPVSTENTVQAITGAVSTRQLGTHDGLSSDF